MLGETILVAGISILYFRWKYRVKKPEIYTVKFMFGKYPNCVYIPWLQRESCTEYEVDQLFSLAIDSEKNGFLYEVGVRGIAVWCGGKEFFSVMLEKPSNNK